MAQCQRVVRQHLQEEDRSLETALVQDDRTQSLVHYRRRRRKKDRGVGAGWGRDDRCTGLLMRTEDNHYLQGDTALLQGSPGTPGVENRRTWEEVD